MRIAYVAPLTLRGRAAANHAARSLTHSARRTPTTSTSTSRRNLTSTPEWDKLGFGAYQTKSMVRADTLDDAWQPLRTTQNFEFKIHPLSNVLHYGQGIFEGLKAFHGKDGKVRVFNSAANAARLQRGAERLLMPVVPPPLFDEAVDRVVVDNLDYVPPYGYGGALYLRPVLFGHGEKLGLGPAPRYTFAVIATPVGAYYKGGLEAIDALVSTEYDRAAPRGVGGVKAAGNYAPDVLPSAQAKDKGFPIVLYLDAQHQKYVEEFSTSNFLGVTADGTLVAPSSPSILPSCTKGVVLQVARDMGIKVEERPLPYEELAQLREVAACGTAVVLTPIKSITRGEEVIKYDSMETIAALYKRVTDIQVADAPDPYGITRVVAEKPHDPAAPKVG